MGSQTGFGHELHLSCDLKTIYLVYYKPPRLEGKSEERRRIAYTGTCSWNAVPTERTARKWYHGRFFTYPEPKFTLEDDKQHQCTITYVVPGNEGLGLPAVTWYSRWWLATYVVCLLIIAAVIVPFVA